MTGILKISEVNVTPHKKVIWGDILLLMCHCCAGVFAIVLLVSLPLLHWHLCCPCAGVFALVALKSLSSLRSLASPSLLCWCLHYVALVLLPLSLWPLPPPLAWCNCPWALRRSLGCNLQLSCFSFPRWH